MAQQLMQHVCCCTGRDGSAAQQLAAEWCAQYRERKSRVPEELRGAMYSELRVRMAALPAFCLRQAGAHEPASHDQSCK